MTRDDIISMARAAGLMSEAPIGSTWSAPLPSADYLERLERFAALVAAAEREECAKVCDEIGGRDSDSHAWDAAAAIRARGFDVPDA